MKKILAFLLAGCLALSLTACGQEPADQTGPTEETVYPACGSANSAIALSPARLAEVSQNFQGWVDVCKAWQK